MSHSPEKYYDVVLYINLFLPACLRIPERFATAVYANPVLTGETVHPKCGGKLVLKPKSPLVLPS
jgi:hypothetical protein